MGFSTVWLWCVTGLPSVAEQLWLPVQLHPDFQMILKQMPSMVDQLVAGCEAKGWHPNAGKALYEFAWDALCGQGDYHMAVIDNTHILLYMMQDVWWLQKEVLVEYSFIRYKPEPADNLTRVFAGIDQLAKQLGVTTVVMSTSASVRNEAYSRVLKSHGYVLGAHQHVKEIS